MTEEIKVNPEAFEKAIATLTQCKTELSQALEYYTNLNNEMKENWIGISGDAFILTERIVEEQFKERITDLENEIEDLNNTMFTMFEEDKLIGQLIGGSIFGAVGSEAAALINSSEDVNKMINSTKAIINDASN
jgi:uncharacterized protein YukE